MIFGAPVHHRANSRSHILPTSLPLGKPFFLYFKKFTHNDENTTFAPHRTCAESACAAKKFLPFPRKPFTLQLTPYFTHNQQICIITLITSTAIRSRVLAWLFFVKDEIMHKPFPPSSLLKMRPFRIPRNLLFCFHRGSTFTKQAAKSQNINSLEQKKHRNLLKRLSCP